MEVNLSQSLSSIEASSQVANGSGTTQPILTKFQYTWTISNFSLCAGKNGERLQSPTFLAGTKNKNSWCLLACPNGNTKAEDGYLSIWLKLLTNNETIEVKAEFSLSIPNEKRKITPVFHVFNKQGSSFGWVKFAQRRTLLDATNHILSEDSSLTIVCDMTIIEGSVNIAIPSDSEELKVPKCRLLDDLSDLFESSKLSDVTLTTSSREFKAHKLILATRSPVFLAMFESGMLEQRQNRVNISDVDDDVLMEMLRLIFTGTTRYMDKMADGLLAAAEKYQLERLKRLCEKSLSESIAIENAASRLLLGDLYGAVFLKAKAVDFICTHTKEVLVTATYKSLRITNPDLIDEVLYAATTGKILPVTSAAATPEQRSKRAKKMKK